MVSLQKRIVQFLLMTTLFGCGVKGAPEPPYPTEARVKKAAPAPVQTTDAPQTQKETSTKKKKQ